MFACALSWAWNAHVPQLAHLPYVCEWFSNEVLGTYTSELTMESPEY